MHSQQRAKYRQAAVAYALYGFVYLGGGLYLIEAGVSEQDSRLWVVIGVAFLLVFPPLIWRGYRWFTRLLALLVGVRVLGVGRVIVTDAGRMVPLPGGDEMPMVYGAAAFLVVALLTCGMLARAGWDLGLEDVRARPG